MLNQLNIIANFTIINIDFTRLGSPSWFYLQNSSFAFITMILLVTISLTFNFLNNLVYKVLNLGVLSVLVVSTWAYNTDLNFIYIVYILAFIGAVVMLFLSVVLMLPSSITTSTHNRFSLYFLSIMTGKVGTPESALNFTNFLNIIIWLLLIAFAFLIVHITMYRFENVRGHYKTFLFLCQQHKVHMGKLSSSYDSSMFLTRFLKKLNKGPALLQAFVKGAVIKMERAKLHTHVWRVVTYPSIHLIVAQKYWKFVAGMYRGQQHKKILDFKKTNKPLYYRYRIQPIVFQAIIYLMAIPFLPLMWLKILYEKYKERKDKDKSSKSGPNSMLLVPIVSLPDLNSFLAEASSILENFSQFISSTTLFVAGVPTGNYNSEAFSEVSDKIFGIDEITVENLKNIQNILYIDMPPLMIVAVSGLLVALIGAAVIQKLNNTKKLNKDSKPVTKNSKITRHTDWNE